MMAECNRWRSAVPVRVGAGRRTVRRGTIVAVLALGCLVALPASANPPFQTDDPGVFPVHTGEAYLFAAGTHTSAGTSLAAAPGAEVNYSALPNTFFHVVVPLSYAAPTPGAQAYGLGNIELGFKWRFLQQDADGLDVATFPLIELPTGHSSRGLGSSRASYFLPVWLEKDWGPWTVYGGGGRWFETEAGRRDWWYGGALVQRQITPDLYLGAEVFHSTAQAVDGRGATAVNIGGGYALGGAWQLLVSAGRNLTDVADNHFTSYIALYRTF